MGVIKHHISKQELEAKYAELKTILAVAQYYKIPQTTASYLFNKLGIQHVKRHANKFNEKFFSQDTSESFYLAGFIAADGNIEKSSNRITIGLAEKDHHFLTQIGNLLEFEGDLSRHISKGSKRNPRYKDTISYFLRFSSSETVKDLLRFNIVPKKTKIYDMPEWIINHQFVHHFMRGYFDGDGCIRIDDGQLSLHIVGNLSFLTKFQSILENRCSIHHNSIHKDRSIYILKYCGNIIVPKICQFLYQDSTFQLDRKHDIYQKIALSR